MKHPPRVRILSKENGKLCHIDNYPNFSVTGSVTGMRKLYYGNDAFLVRCGSWIYKVPAEIYDRDTNETIYRTRWSGEYRQVKEGA